jgi:hypothetical protein
MAEAQRAAGMEVNFLGDSFVAKNMTLSSRTSG